MMSSTLVGSIHLSQMVQQNLWLGPSGFSFLESSREICHDCQLASSYGDLILDFFKKYFILDFETFRQEACKFFLKKIYDQN
jgi:hypothetical protein